MSSSPTTSPASDAFAAMTDDQRLVDFIREHALATRVVIQARKRLSGGAIQENWLLELLIDGGPWAGARRWVLRSDALSALPASLDRAQEFAVLQVVHQAGVKVPRPLWLCRDAGVHGRVFFLMEYLPGVATGRLLSAGAGANGQARLATQLGANLARLHQVRPPCAALDFLPVPDGSPALATVSAYRHYLDTLAEAYPVLEWGLRWCEVHAPRSSSLCLLHRDYRTGNYLASEQGLEAVLDWEFTGWGDPCEDLGWFTARCWRFTRPDLEAGGIGLLEDFLRGYHEVSSLRIEPSQLHFWQVMATLRWAVIALQQGQRHLSGEEPSLELALTARLLPELELDILNMTGGDAP
ncbi:phosphotransferase family protein [Pseudomonas sp. NFIX28]|uniref:phosphotransferase family protein n=1 Tax=Pseudomonas sp. NFIX28 TaxID=1566235 RepID=UPI00089C1F87|nr:phosphotransferase family protein [Pseudomonas sp. NFIX28]SDY42812.1 Predicted kinase, aminoglycoside phosphotransferase (APT) family [Pseudomonas sp. NFIX28]